MTQGFSEKSGISGKSDLHVLNKEKSKTPTSKVSISPQSKKDLALVEKDPWNLRNIKNQTLQIALAAVKQRGNTLQFVKNQTPEIALEAVKQEPSAIQFVKNQTPEIALAAVKDNSWNFKYIKTQTPELALISVKQDGTVLEHVKNQTPEIIEAAVKQNNRALKFIKNSTVQKKWKKHLETACNVDYENLDMIEPGTVASSDFFEKNLTKKEKAMLKANWKTFLSNYAQDDFDNLYDATLDIVTGHLSKERKDIYEFSEDIFRISLEEAIEDEHGVNAILDLRDAMTEHGGSEIDSSFDVERPPTEKNLKDSLFEMIEDGSAGNDIAPEKYFNLLNHGKTVKAWKLYMKNEGNTTAEDLGYFCAYLFDKKLYGDMSEVIGYTDGFDT